MELGKPIGGGTAPRDGFDQGEHGAGVGLSGGHGQVNSQNTQAGKFAQEERSGFNAGLGGEHASGGLPGHSSHPIADKFTGGHNDSHGVSGPGAAALAATAAGAGAASGDYGSSRGDAVSGAYAGQGTSDALTGESHALRTGAGVGPQGENLSSGHSHSHHGATGAAGALAAAGAGTGLAAGEKNRTALGSGHETGTGHYSSGQTGEQFGTGVGASGGAGGHYRESNDTSSHHGVGAGAAGVGAGAAGLGAAGIAGHRSNRENNSSSTTDKHSSSESDFNRGAPLSDPKDLDTGNKHSLVFNEATGKYEHRHDIEHK